MRSRSQPRAAFSVGASRPSIPQLSAARQAQLAGASTTRSRSASAPRKRPPQTTSLQWQASPIAPRSASSRLAHSTVPASSPPGSLEVATKLALMRKEQEQHLSRISQLSGQLTALTTENKKLAAQLSSRKSHPSTTSTSSKGGITTSLPAGYRKAPGSRTRTAPPESQSGSLVEQLQTALALSERKRNKMHHKHQKDRAHVAALEANLKAAESDRDKAKKVLARRIVQLDSRNQSLELERERERDAWQLEREQLLQALRSRGQLLEVPTVVPQQLASDYEEQLIATDEGEAPLSPTRSREAATEVDSGSVISDADGNMSVRSGPARVTGAGTQVYAPGSVAGSVAASVVGPRGRDDAYSVVMSVDGEATAGLPPLGLARRRVVRRPFGAADARRRRWHTASQATQTRRVNKRNARSQTTKQWISSEAGSQTDITFEPYVVITNRDFVDETEPSTSRSDSPTQHAYEAPPLLQAGPAVDSNGDEMDSQDALDDVLGDVSSLYSERSEGEVNYTYSQAGPDSTVAGTSESQHGPPSPFAGLQKQPSRQEVADQGPAGRPPKYATKYPDRVPAASGVVGALSSDGSSPGSEGQRHGLGLDADDVVASIAAMAGYNLNASSDDDSIVSGVSGFSSDSSLPLRSSRPPVEYRRGTEARESWGQANETENRQRLATKAYPSDDSSSLGGADDVDSDLSDYSPEPAIEHQESPRAVETAAATEPSPAAESPPPNGTATQPAEPPTQQPQPIAAAPASPPQSPLPEARDPLMELQPATILGRIVKQEGSLVYRCAVFSKLKKRSHALFHKWQPRTFKLIIVTALTYMQRTVPSSAGAWHTVSGQTVAVENVQQVLLQYFVNEKTDTPKGSINLRDYEARLCTNASIRSKHPEAFELWAEGCKLYYLKSTQTSTDQALDDANQWCASIRQGQACVGLRFLHTS